MSHATIPPSAPSSGRIQAVILLVALLGLMALELPWLSRPPFDAHAFRQSQTLATIELFARDGIDLAHAKTNYVGEPGVFVLEMPLFQAVCALLYGWFGPHTWIVRLVNLLCVLGNAALTFGIGRRLFNRDAGFAAALIYLFAPLNLVYMTSTLLDPSATLCSLTAFLFALRILHQRRGETVAGFGVWAVFALACVVTALIKTLYLFPVCVLLAATFCVRRKLSVQLLAAGICVLASTGLFFLWLRHSREVNDASWFTRGVNPTSLLGFKPLLLPAYYKELARRVLLHLMGPVGTLLAVGGLVAVFRPADGAARGARFPVVVLVASVAGYFAAFSTANYPHDYYSLIVSPYGCLIAGLGALEVARRAAETGSRWAVPLARPAFVTLLAIIASAAMFLKQPRLTPGRQMLELQRLSAGHFEPWAFAMVFAAPDPRLPMPANLGSEMPEALYATGLRGTGRLVADSSSALAFWKDHRPHYQHLQYVVFYGVTPPPEIVQSCREAIVTDPARKWFAYKVE